jgi:glycosylphosphatidylinositol transamidase (GPIT) subunit GPI8
VGDVNDIRGCYESNVFNLSGNRLFPNPCLKDEEAFKIAEKTNVFSILEKSDTLYMFSNRELFSENVDKNQYLPIINDSAINFFYSNKYAIALDTDPPKWTLLENEKDTIIMELKSQGYDNNGLLLAIITDTIFQFKDGLKIGIDKSKFFQAYGIDFKYNKKDFTVILTSIFESNVSWYYRYYCSKYTDETYCNPDGFHTRSYLKYLLTYKNDKLIKIKVYL